MFSAVQPPLLFGLIAASLTTIGLIAVALRGDWGLRYANVFTLVAAGLLTTTAFLHIIPEAFFLSDQAPIWLTAGFFGGLFLHTAMKTALPDLDGATLPSEAVTPILAIAVHSFLDGVLYSLTFAASFSSGLMTALGLLIHKLPEGIVAFAILRRHGVSSQTSLMLAFLAAAATTPIGVLVSGPFLAGLGETALGGLFAVSAGLILFVATGPLMAPLKELRPANGFAALATGVSIAIVLLLLPLPGHDHSQHSHADHDHAEHDHTHHEHVDGHAAHQE